MSRAMLSSRFPSKCTLQSQKISGFTRSTFIRCQLAVIKTAINFYNYRLVTSLKRKTSLSPYKGFCTKHLGQVLKATDVRFEKKRSHKYTPVILSCIKMVAIVQNPFGGHLQVRSFVGLLYKI